MSVDDMKYLIALYYEVAGASDVYERKLNHKTDEEIIKLYHSVFPHSNDQEEHKYKYK